MKILELLEEQVLIQEKLGNLASLKVGKMIDILRQYNMQNKKHGNSASHAHTKFAGNGQSIADTSEIVDIGTLKAGFTDLKKAYKKYETAKAFALYIADKAVAFGTFDEYDLGGSSRSAVLAYDLTAFKDEIDKAHEAKLATKSEWDRKYGHNPKQKITSAREEQDKWDEKRPIKKYAGESTTTGELKVFIDNLYSLADGKPITAKLVLHSQEAAAKRGKRYSNKISKNELFTGLDALKDRLKKYKISKKPTVSTIKEFLDITLKKSIKEVQFAGRGWSTVGGKGYSDTSAADVMNGKAFTMHYKSIDPGSYDSIEISFKFDSSTMMIVPFKAKWTGKDEAGKSQSEFAVLEKETYFKDTFGVKSMDKTEIIKTMLTNMKNGQLSKVRDMLKACKQADIDYPEFKTIEKSLDIEEKKKKEQQ